MAAAVVEDTILCDRRQDIVSVLVYDAIAKLQEQLHQAHQLLEMHSLVKGANSIFKVAVNINACCNKSLFELIGDVNLAALPLIAVVSLCEYASAVCA